MKKVFLLAVIIAASNVSAQNKKVVELLNTIEGQWSQDDVTKNVTYVSVVELPDLSKKEIYTLCDNFLLGLYDDIGKANIDKDFETGRLSSIGWFGETYTGFILASIYYTDVKHILSIDTKDGKARISLVLTDIKQYNNERTYEYLHRNQYPVNENSGEKNFFGKAFYNTHLVSLKMIEKFEETLRAGEEKKDDW